MKNMKKVLVVLGTLFRCEYVEPPTASSLVRTDVLWVSLQGPTRVLLSPG